MILNAGWIWVLFPAGVAVFLLLWPAPTRTRGLVAAGVALGLALLAGWLPTDKVVMLVPGRVFIQVRSQWVFLGRTFTLGEAFRPWLMGLYLSLAMWLATAAWARMHPTFVGLALGMAVFLVMALTVRPFLYAALLVEMAVLAAVPLFAPGEEPVGEGAIRYVAWMTLALPFLLLSGVYLAGLETAPLDSPLVRRAVPFLVAALLPWLGILPFHSVAPALGETTHPYRAAFVLTLVTTAVTVFAIGFLERFTWLRTAETTYLALRVVGMGMFLLGSLWAPFQLHAGRSLGYAWMAENGLGLLALGLGNGQGLTAFTLLLPPRMLLMWMLALGLSVLTAPTGILTRDALWGRGRERPWAAGLWVLGWLSLAAWPWTPGIWGRWAVAQGLVAHGPLWMGLFILGLLALTGTALRWWRILWAVREEDELAWPRESSWDKVGLLAAYGLFVAALLAAPALWAWAQWAVQSFPLLAGR